MADHTRLAALTLLAAGLLLPGLLIGPSLDAAVFVQVASQIREGDVLYVDAWDHKPPGTVLALLVFGSPLPFVDPWVVSWLVSVAATIGSGMAVAAVLEAAAVRSLPASLAGGAAVVLMAQYLMALGGGLTEPIATVLLALALAIAVRARTAPRTVAVGALLTASVLTSIPVVAGAAVVGSIVIRTARRRLAAAASMGLGGLVPVVGLAAWLAATDALGPGIDAVVSYAGAYRQSNEGMGRALSMPVVSWTLLAFLFVIVPAIMGAIAAMRAGGERRQLVIACVAWILFSIGLYIYQGRFFAHYAIPLAIPLGILAGLGLDHVTAQRQPRGRIARAGRLLPFLLALIISATASTVAGGMEWSALARQRERVDRVGDAIEGASAPGDTIWVWGNVPQLYQAAHRAPATFYSYLYPLVSPGYTTPGMIAATLRDLTSHPPILIIDAGSSAPKAPGLPALLIPRPLVSDGRDLDLLDPLRAFVRERYIELEVVDGWVIYLLDS